MARRLSVAARRRVAVVGAGWAGLAAAVEATAARLDVTVFDMARHVGGRARGVSLTPDLTLDNGQHILIGAYRETLGVMSRVGVAPAEVLRRLPLELRYPDGAGLKVARGPVLWGFGLGVLRAEGWSWGDRLGLLRTAFGWWRRGMRNPGIDTVRQLCAGLPERVVAEMIDPLCVAALNTPSEEASATVFLRVLADALFGESGSSDLLLPRTNLSELFPRPAAQWLQASGSQVHLGRRVNSLIATDRAWSIDGEAFDAVVLACSAHEAARLASSANPGWADEAEALRYEPIATVYLRRSAQPLPVAMMALRADAERSPAQFVFDLDLLGVAPATLAFVVSGARPWLIPGLDALAQAVMAQAQADLPTHLAIGQPLMIHATAERRATFSCVPGLRRPSMVVAPGLFAAGDYIAGPYPATLEGSVRSGLDAARQLIRP